jgi:steroid delta-isomerase-like uncharacterized protein
MGNAVDNHKRVHANFKARDWAAMEKMVTENCEYEDKPRGLTMKHRSEFIDWVKDWATFMSDAEVGEPQYIDGGSYSVARFTGRGLNDGPMGNIPATGKRLSMPFCEILHWTDSGQFDRGEMYYDAMTMMVQLGVMEPPA